MYSNTVFYPFIPLISTGGVCDLGDLLAPTGVVGSMPLFIASLGSGRAEPLVIILLAPGGPNVQVTPLGASASEGP